MKTTARAVFLLLLLLLLLLLMHRCRCNFIGNHGHQVSAIEDGIAVALHLDFGALVKVLAGHGHCVAQW